jgi:hypothetical protein
MARTKEHLKRRIIETLSKTASGRKHSPETLERIADDVLRLFQARAHAPAHQKRRIWRNGERKILRELRQEELLQVQQAVAHGART